MKTKTLVVARTSKKVSKLKIIRYVLLIGTVATLLMALSGCETYDSSSAKQVAEKPLPLKVYHQAGEDDLTIVFAPEGYLAEDMAQFRKEVELACEMLRQTKPFAYCMNHINLYAIELASTDSVTAFGLETPKPDQVFAPVQMDSIKQLMKRLPCAVEKTVLVIMANVKDSYLGYTLVSEPCERMSIPETAVIQSLFSYNPTVLLHEVGGHAIGLLADEYGSDTALDDESRTELLNYQERGLFQNVSVSDNTPSWQWMLGDDDFSAEGMGIFEGGYGCAEGILRSTQNSVMRHHTLRTDFTPYQRYLIYSRIERVHSGREVSYAEWKTIDLAYQQPPVDFAAITGNRRSQTHATGDYDRNDVVIVKE
ncbi:MAG: hypothetical protein IJV17_05005 [Prevotella sp.]|nr:hypothetical protein [Prevotella sp.]